MLSSNDYLLFVSLSPGASTGILQSKWSINICCLSENLDHYTHLEIDDKLK